MHKLIVVAFLLAGCSDKSETPISDKTQDKSNVSTQAAGPLDVKRIHWSSSNPSIDRGPTSSASVSASAFDSPKEWNAAVDKLLDDTKVNGVVSLRTYLEARRNQSAVVLTAVDLADTKKLGAGGGYASVTFSFSEGKSVSIRNLKKTTLSGNWNFFWSSHLQAKITESPSFDSPLKDPPLKPDPNKLPNQFLAGDLKLPSKHSLHLKERDGTTPVGVVDIDKNGKITIVSLTGEHQERVKHSVAKLNAKDGFSVQVVPPSGKSGKWGKFYKRGEKWFGAALRQNMADSHQLKLRITE